MAGLEEIVDNEDFYSLLNVPRDVSKEDLRLSYRRLCMQYHPDKHADGDRREAADVFNKVQYAYDVLSDPNKRHIYDAYGKKGLEGDWQLVERKRTPQELQEEYERIQRRRQLQRLNEATNPTGNFTMTVDATSIFDSPVSYDDDDEYYDSVSIPEISKVSISQSVEAPLTASDTATISGQMSSSNGKGRGELSVALKRMISPLMWGELSCGVSDRKFMSFGLRGYRALPHGLFAIVHVPVTVLVQDNFLVVSMPEYSTVLGCNLRPNLVGTLEYTTGQADRLCTQLIYDMKPMRIIGKLQVGDPSSFAQIKLSHRFLSDKAEAKAGLKISPAGFFVEYGAEHQISEFSRIGATVAIGVPIGVVLKLRMSRASQSYYMPVLLSDDVNFVAAFYATAVPVVFYFALQKLVVQPYLRKKKIEEEESEESNRSQETAQRKEEAERQVRLMAESVERKILSETSKHGLVITEAWYGKLMLNADEHASSPRVIDVKIPLQNLVENSAIQLPHDISKSGLPGFCDPCPGCDKSLKISYKFRNRRHHVIVEDKEKLRLPLKSHLIDGAA